MAQILAAERGGGRVLERRVDVARSFLISEVARASTTTTYGVVGELTGVIARSVGRVILEPISRYEHRHGRPMLTALVVLDDTKIPGTGFFDLAREYGRLTDQGEVGFWYEECERVYEYWR